MLFEFPNSKLISYWPTPLIPSTTCLRRYYLLVNPLRQHSSRSKSCFIERKKTENGKCVWMILLGCLSQVYFISVHF